MAESTNILSLKRMTTIEGGNGGDMDTLTRRVGRLEKNMLEMAMELTKLSVRANSFASKEDVQTIRTDMHKEISSQTKWLAATLIGVAGLSLAMARYLFR